MPKRHLFNSIDEFRAAAKDGGTVEPDSQIRTSFETEVRAGEGDSRVLTFTISTASVDRMGDTIAVDGWNLDAYRKNPVVLWAHDSQSLPVAKSNKIWIEAQKLKSETEFTPLGMARFNDTVFDMLKGGFLSATSVGFQPLKWAWVDDPERRYGIDFLQQELLEFSVVPVPANPEALIEGKAAGIDMAPLLDWCETQLRRVDGARVLAFAESILGADGQDAAAIGFAERIAAKVGKGLFSRDRIERIERAAKQKRLSEQRSRDLGLIRARAG